MSYEAVIGLEVHAQLLTNSKIFCGCSAAFGGAPNTHVCPICLGMPGVLPVLNKRAISYTMKMALAVGGRIAEVSQFARKNYFYPDLPKGYQISQYDRAGEPVSIGGGVEIETDDGSHFIRLRRIHVEEEAGKSIHDEPGYISGQSYIDYNRAGVPLIEIVSEPDIKTPQQAAAFLTRLRQLVQYIGVCDGNMEEGSMRCDANVSVRKPGEPYGELAEIKNLNSIRAVERAITYEVDRQIDAKRNGEDIVRETRSWDEGTKQTFSTRSKEEASDYRYFPDPDLVSLEIDRSWVEQIDAELPELPHIRQSRFESQYKLPRATAQTLTETRDRADYFEEVAEIYDDARTVGNWMLSELLRVQKEHRWDIHELARRIPVAHFASLLQKIEEEEISGKIAKNVLDKMAISGDDPGAIIEAEGLRQISDSVAIESIVEEVIEANPAEAEAYRAGKTKLIGFFVGLVMKATKGQASPKLVNEMLRDRLA